MDETSVKKSLESVWGQLTEDRRYMAEMQLAMEQMHHAQKSQEQSMAALEQRLDDQARQRFDEQRFNAVEKKELEDKLDERLNAAANDLRRELEAIRALNVTSNFDVKLLSKFSLKH